MIRGGLGTFGIIACIISQTCVAVLTACVDAESITAIGYVRIMGLVPGSVITCAVGQQWIVVREHNC